jgi:CRP-like cAMP-binding protein
VADEAASLERILAFKSAPDLAGLAARELATLAEAAAPERCRAGEPPWEERESARLHLVVEGRVRVTRCDGEVRDHGAHSLLGAPEVLAGNAAPPAVAVEDTLLFSIERGALLDILEDDFATALAVLRHLGRESLAVRRRLGEISRPVPGTIAAPDPSRCLELGERIALLRSTPPFPGVRVHTLGQIALDMRPVTLAAGERAWRRGDRADWTGIVLTGEVTPGPRRRTRTVGPGALLGMEEALAGESRWYAAVARKPTLLLRLDVASLIDVLEDDPDMAVEVLTVLARDLLELPGWRVGRAHA